MKKLFLIFIAVSAVLASSCSKEEGQDSSIVGKWKYEELNSFVYTFIYEFKANGTGTLDYTRTGSDDDPAIPSQITNFTYSLNGDKLTLNMDGEDKQTAIIIIKSLTKDKLNIEFKDNETGETENATWYRI